MASGFYRVCSEARMNMMIRSSMESASGERPPILQKLIKHVKKIAIIAYMFSLMHAYSMIGGFGPYAEHTRVSEHALMPGLVNVHFNDDALLTQYIQGLLTNRGSRREYVCESLEKSGVPCYEQNWRSTVAIQNQTGKNVYGVVRAHRATGVESMLIAVDLLDNDSVASALAFAAYARRQVYWARDIFFVFVDNGVWGMDAFLSSYHLVPGIGIDGDPLEASGGMIIGALVIKTHNIKGNRKAPMITLELNQMNGQLPNLDLFNSLVRIASRQTPMIESIIYNIHEIVQEVFQNPILIPLRAMYTQAFVNIEGAHSVMSKYGVQGLTLGLPARNVYPLRESTKLVEAGVRALNNILERFHQSYFMYILTSELNFLSIAFYMPAMAVLLPFILMEWTDMKTFRIPLAFVGLHIPGIILLCSSSYYFSLNELNETSTIVLLSLMAIPFGLFAPIHPDTLTCMRFLLYLETALICVSLSLINFSLAFVCSIIITPVMLIVTKAVAEKRKIFVRTLLTLACHPLCLFLFLLVIVRPYLLFRDDKNLEVGLITVSSAITAILSEYLVFGSWMYPLLCSVGLFFWNATLCLASSFVESESEKEKIE